MTIALVLQCS